MVGRAAFFNGLLRKQSELQRAISHLLPQSTFLRHLLTNSSTLSLNSSSSSLVKGWLRPLDGFESKRVCREDDGLIILSSGKSERCDPLISFSSIHVARMIWDNSILLVIKGTIRVHGDGDEENGSGELLDWNRFIKGTLVVFHPNCAFRQYCGEIQVESECQYNNKQGNNPMQINSSQHNNNNNINLMNDNLNTEKFVGVEIRIIKSSVQVETMLTAGRKLALFWSPSPPRCGTMKAAKNETKNHHHTLSNSLVYVGEVTIEQGEGSIPLQTQPPLFWKLSPSSSRLTTHLGMTGEEAERCSYPYREVFCLDSWSTPGCRHLVRQFCQSLLEELMKWKMELLVSISFYIMERLICRIGMVRQFIGFRES